MTNSSCQQKTIVLAFVDDDDIYLTGFDLPQTATEFDRSREVFVSGFALI